jgi:hypothetical protein
VKFDRETFGELSVKRVHRLNFILGLSCFCQRNWPEVWADCPTAAIVIAHAKIKLPRGLGSFAASERQADESAS